MILGRSCSLNAVADILASLLGQSFNTMREKLRDTYRDADAKSGKQRAELDVTLCWGPWLAWILDGWEGQQLAIAMDATNLGDRSVVLAISVVYRGCAVPVAWKILKAREKHPWKAEWLALLRHLRCNACQIHWRKRGGYFVSKYFFGRLTNTAFDDFRCRISKKLIGACF